MSVRRAPRHRAADDDEGRQLRDTFTVLTVCTGNVHRSTLAAELLATWAHWYLPPETSTHVVVTSAGTGAPVGEPMGHEVRMIAERLGAGDSGHRATQLTDQIADAADLVLTASEEHKEEIIRLSPRVMRRTFTMLEAGRIAAHLDAVTPQSLHDLRSTVDELARRRIGGGEPGDDDIIDPHGRDAGATDLMISQEVPALVSIAMALWGMPAGEAQAYLRAASDPAALRQP